MALVGFDAGGKKLHTISLAATQKLFVGQKVIALGNPFGLERTLTTGVISGVNRPLITEDGLILKDLIQTDAAINPGNSGGPLLNSKGELIGMNTLIISPSGGSVGIGFAVPLETIQRVVPDLMAHGKVQRGWIDIVPVPLYPALVKQAKLPKVQGLLVSEVSAGSLAEQSGLRGGDKRRFVTVEGQRIYLGGDIIYGINNRSTRNLVDYFERAGRYQAQRYCRR